MDNWSTHLHIWTYRAIIDTNWSCYHHASEVPMAVHRGRPGSPIACLFRLRCLCMRSRLPAMPRSFRCLAAPLHPPPGAPAPAPPCACATRPTVPGARRPRVLAADLPQVAGDAACALPRQQGATATSTPATLGCPPLPTGCIAGHWSIIVGHGVSVRPLAIVVHRSLCVPRRSICYVHTYGRSRHPFVVASGC